MPGRTRCRSWFVIALTLLTALDTATPAWAWGRLGHRVEDKHMPMHVGPCADPEIAGDNSVDGSSIVGSKE